MSSDSMIFCRSIFRCRRYLTAISRVLLICTSESKICWSCSIVVENESNIWRHSSCNTWADFLSTLGIAGTSSSDHVGNALAAATTAPSTKLVSIEGNAELWYSSSCKPAILKTDKKESMWIFAGLEKFISSQGFCRICFTPRQIGCQLKNGTPKVVENGFVQQVIVMLMKATENILVSKIFESKVQF